MAKLAIILLALFIFSCSGNKNQKNGKVQFSENQITDKENTGVVPQIEEEKQAETKKPANNMIYFEGGTFLMGSANGLPQEKPVHEVKLKPFYMDVSPVTVEEFRAFVDSTGFKTEAEKFGDSGVFNLDAGNWELLPGAFWAKPFGPKGPDAEHDHPVTHISWNDAVTYAAWAGKRLPTEAEWEYAARSGKNSGNKFSWGNPVSANGKYFANTWQGTLQAPETADGFLYTSPVGVFGTNEAGLTDMGGNVWQWCADTYKSYPGNAMSERVDPNVKVIRGGSFFFDEYGENSFSVSFRGKNSAETSLFNTGFRCAKDAGQ